MESQTLNPQVSPVARKDSLLTGSGLTWSRTRLTRLTTNLEKYPNHSKSIRLAGCISHAGIFCVPVDKVELKKKKKKPNITRMNILARYSTCAHTWVILSLFISAVRSWSWTKLPYLTGKLDMVNSVFWAPLVTGPPVEMKLLQTICSSNGTTSQSWFQCKQTNTKAQWIKVFSSLRITFTGVYSHSDWHCLLETTFSLLCLTYQFGSNLKCFKYMLVIRQNENMTWPLAIPLYFYWYLFMFIWILQCWWVWTCGALLYETWRCSDGARVLTSSR